MAVHEIARAMALLEAIDRDLDERGLEDKRGKPRYLLSHRWRVSRQLADWLAQISDSLARQTAAGEDSPPVGRDDYVRELQRIALGDDPSASARDRLGALNALINLDSDTSAKGAIAHLHFGQESNGEDQAIELDTDPTEP